MNKPHLEFTRVNMTEGWASLPGYPAGIKQKILASDLDENRKMGSRTRLLKFDRGVYTTAPFLHDHWEEVYLITGDLIVGNDAQGRGGEAFSAPPRRRSGWRQRCDELSSSAKADDPVTRGLRSEFQVCGYWMPAFAGMTSYQWKRRNEY